MIEPGLVFSLACCAIRTCGASTSKLIVGAHNYVVRSLLGSEGGSLNGQLGGNKDKGLQYLKNCAREKVTSVDAQILLVLLRREHRYDEALSSRAP
jgi:hypothetical protein